jgi:hypothetical protein
MNNMTTDPISASIRFCAYGHSLRGATISELVVNCMAANVPNNHRIRPFMNVLWAFILHEKTRLAALGQCVFVASEGQRVLMNRIPQVNAQHCMNIVMQAADQ